jgi:hypothetical protein
LAESFAAIGTPIQARLKTIESDAFAGVYVLTGSHVVKPLYMLTTATFTDDEGISAKTFVAQATNNKEQLFLESVDRSIHRNVAIVVSDITLDAASPWLANAGEPFKKADLAAQRDLQALLPDGDEHYRIFIVTRCVPILFGTSEVHRGTIDEACLQLMEENLPGSGDWCRLANYFDQARHDAIAAALSEDNTCFKKKLKIKKGCLPLADTMFVSTVPVYPEDEEMNSAFQSVKKRLADIMPDTPVEAVDLTSGVEDADDAKSGITAATPIPRTLPIPRKSAFTSKWTEDDITAMKYRLTMCGYSPEQGLYIPELTDEMAHTYHMISGKKNRVAHLATILTGFWENECDDDDFLHRSSDLPGLDNVTMALLLNGYVATTPLTSLDTTGATAFRSFMLAPDNAASMAERAAKANNRDIEEICGEEGVNLTKVNTSVVANTAIFNENMFLSFLANCSLLSEATVRINTLVWADASNPLAYKFSRSTARLLTNKKVKRYWKTATSQQRTRLLCWCLQLLDNCTCLINQVAANTTNVLYALADDLSRINVAPLIQALALHEEFETKLIRVVMNTDSVPLVPIAAAHENRVAKRQLEANESAARKKAKLQQDRQQDRQQPEEGDKSGVFVWNGAGLMPSIRQSDQRLRVCIPFSKEGSFCARGRRCKCIHNKDPSKWDPEKVLKPWYEFVEATADLSWAPGVDVAALKAIVDRV